MTISRRQLLAATAAGASFAPFAPFAPLARAQAGESFKPARTVRLVVPFPAGGPTDALARQIAESAALRWKQTVIVDNRPGGNTVLGTEVVARSAPDGLTLGMVTGSHIINPLLMAKMPYDTSKDLTGVMLLTRFHMALYAHPSLPASTPEELVALAGREADQVAYAYATTQTFLAMELFNSMAGVRMRNIPYKGSAQAMTDLLGGHVQLLIDPLTQGALDQVKAGKLKLIGTMAAQHADMAPDAPLASRAVPGYDFSGAFGLVARGGTPPQTVRQIRDDIAAILQQPAIVARIRDIGQEAIGSTPEQYDAYIASETAKWRPVVVRTGVKLD
jgi:tripartite-type tricarboxylate transporter receptor subunit TctC